MNNTDPLLLITEYRQRFVGSTAEKIVLDACEDAIRTLREERDEARWLICQAQSRTSGKSPEHYAEMRGWDCFRREALNRLAAMDQELGLI